MYDVFVSWSGGKDSTCSLYLNLMKGYKVYARCFIPVYDHGVPLIRKAHFNFILSTADYFRHEGVDVDIVYGKQTFKEYCLSPISRGPRKGMIRGFPIFLPKFCGYKHVKVEALNSNLPDHLWSDIGIAVDEIERHSQINDYRRSILLTEGFTEYDCFKTMRKLGLLSPIYNTTFRDGCALCGNASLLERNLWMDEWNVREDVFNFQETVRSLRPNQAPLRNFEFWIDPFQISMFG